MLAVTLYDVVEWIHVMAVVIAFGAAFKDAGAAMRPLGDAFIRLIRMIVAPAHFGQVYGFPVER